MSCVYDQEQGSKTVRQRETEEEEDKEGWRERQKKRERCRKREFVCVLEDGGGMYWENIYR